MDQITDEERRRIAELVAEGAPPWKLHQEISRSRYAIRRAVIALQRQARRERERSPLRLSLVERVEMSRGLAAGRCGQSPAGPRSVDGVPGGVGERRARAVPGVYRRPAGGAPDAASKAGEAGRVPAAAGGGEEQAGVALVAAADRGLAGTGLSR